MTNKNNMNQTVTFHNASTIDAIGESNTWQCKAVYCKETGDIYSSIKDAAHKAGVHHSMMSGHLRGKYKSVKGLHYAYLSDVLDNPNEVFARQREMYMSEAEAQRVAAANAEDAAKWRAYQATLAAEAIARTKQEEKERKAQEKRAAEEAKAKARIARHEARRKKLAAQLMATDNSLTAARHQLSLLTGAVEDEDVA